MQRAAFALVVAAFLSGCAQDAPADDPVVDVPETQPVPATFLFEPARQVATVANTQHEAFIAVSPDGQVILSCAHGDFTEPANMFASTDGGATFREVVADEAMLPAGDCEVALAPDGTWTFSGKTELGIAVASTSDQGATWRVNHLAGPPLNGLADRQWMAYVGNTLLMTYQPGTQQAGQLLFTRSEDHGATWTQPVALATSDPQRAGISAGDFVVSPDGGAVHFVLSNEVPLTAATYELVTSTDAGVTWQRRPLSLSSLDAYPSVPALTPTGLLVWPYVDDQGLFAVVSADGGATWSEPAALASGVGWPRLGSSARPDGLVDVVWMSDGAQFGNGEGLALTRFDPASFEVVNQSIVADIGFLEYAAVGHDASGRAHAVVMDAPSKLDGDVSTDMDGGLLYVRETLA